MSAERRVRGRKFIAILSVFYSLVQMLVVHFFLSSMSLIDLKRMHL